MTWVEGGPPESLYGVVVLAVLRPDLFAPGRPEPWDEYYGDPVAVRWWGHKGKTTFGVKLIAPGDVLRYAVIPDTGGET